MVVSSTSEGPIRRRMGASCIDVLNLSQSVDDTAWATASRGTLFSTDGKSKVFAVTGRFDVGMAFSAAPPGNANNAPPNPAPNFLATLDLNTGAVTPVPGITFTAKGLVFVPGEGDEEGGDSAAQTQS
jgi:hypothetical protein